MSGTDIRFLLRVIAGLSRAGNMYGSILKLLQQPLHAAWLLLQPDSPVLSTPRSTPHSGGPRLAGAATGPGIMGGKGKKSRFVGPV